ncbi:unnamed protein product [Prunus armeniaca]|uniref:BHLH domain-containing protein n=1 Tax=Prunus armeniaca TaxID=36596 RepID=A0A6J5WBW0_PRUAR|nr:unnamed protein product [Prunus armeniaca]
MELSEHSFLEELLALRRDSTWETIPTEMNEFLSSSGSWGNFGYLDQNPPTFFPNSSCTQEFSPPFEPNLSNCYNNNNTTFNEVYYPLGFGAGEDGLSAQQQLTDSSYNTLDTPPFPVQKTIHGPCLKKKSWVCLGMKYTTWRPKLKQPAKWSQFSPLIKSQFSTWGCVRREITGMDRTSILGDTIDYMKELLERINNLQQEIETDADQLNVMSLFKDVKPNEMLVRNSPKFDVQRRNVDTRIDICCAGKPGLLLSTVSTLEALGLEIQQCVISCFNDFAMQASCSEDLIREQQ